MSNTIALRKEIPVEFTWDADSVFASEQAWEGEIQKVGQQLEAAKTFKGKLGQAASTLADYVEVAEGVRASLGKIVLYAGMFHHVDTTDQRATAKFNRARSLFAQALGALAFDEPELLEIGIETLSRWTQQEPRLAHLGHYFERLEQRREHVRSAEVEALLNQAMDVFQTGAATHGILSDADLTFAPAVGATEEAQISQGMISTLLGSPDGKLRRSAWEHYADAYLAFKNTTANCLAMGVKRDVFLARARGYDSSLEAALAPNHIPLDVFFNLIDTFKKHLPTWHRYWGIRRRALGEDALGVYDTRAPLTGHTTEVSFAQAMDWICEGMAPLGPTYVEVMKKGVKQQRWVDVYPNKGKRMGAFSSGVQGTHPFIMMSYGHNLFGMSTLAHELGHSMHSYYAWQNQPQAYSSYSLFVAEVASNFNQALVRAHLLSQNSDPNFQIEIIEEAMANFHRYFFIMPTLARFELEIHERVERGQPLTAQDLIELMADLFAEGYGDEVLVDRERVGITWAQFATHLYANFYVFQYATGISGAHALANKVLAQGERAAQSYLEFLAAGGSLYPLDALALAGVELASPEAVEQTFAVLAGYIDRLGQLLGDKA